MKHIIESHEREFQENGITNEKIPNLIKKAAKDDQIVRTSAANRPVYETKYNGKIIHTAITINSNGYIASAHIATRRWKEKKIKMKIIRLLLEYGCYPIWTYEKKDVLTENDFPEENPPSQRLDELKTIIAKEYMVTFVNNAHEFSYKGFDSKEECQKFVDKLTEFRDLVQKEYSKKYKIIDDFDDYSDELK